MNRFRVGIPLSIFLFFMAFAAKGQCGCTDCRCSDSLELVKLYNATNGANWTVRDTLGTKSPWILTQPITTWYGIALTNGRVTWIDLDGIADFNSAGSTGATGNGLSGQLPTLSFSELTDLFLDVNQLTGSLPHLVLPKIDVISISFNPQLKGTIPTSWSFPTLQYLDACHNGLDGTLPTLNFPNLKGLYLHVNKLTGALPTINAPLLADIRMTANQFTGCFPASYHRYCPFTYAWFDDNPGLPNFNDFCRDSSGMCAVQDTTTCRYQDSLALVTLYDATGGDTWRKKTNWKSNRPLNEWYGVYTNTDGCVIALDLDGKNDYNWSDTTGNNLSGYLPSAIGNLSQLTFLSLNGNNGLIGTFPPSFSNLSLLKSCFIRRCQFTSIPDFFWTMPNLGDVDLSLNPFNSTLSPLVGSMKKVNGLLIGTNGLIGNLPPELGQDTTLKKLDLCNNKLTGIVPKALTNLKLQVLGLCGNNLDSFPDFSNADYRNYGWTGWGNGGVYIGENNFTFDDILPNMRFASVGNGFVFDYSPQDSIFKDTTITARIGAPLSIDLKIDGGLTDNLYSWKRNDTIATSNGASNLNRFIRNTVSVADAGVYTCQVTNMRAPLLTLNSRKITVVVLPALVDTTTCRYQDSLALIALYDATDGPNWRNKTNWKSNRPLNEWYGIYTNTEGCVIGIDLDGTSNNTWSIDSMGNDLRGQLPSTLGNGNLSKLQVFILNGNQGLTGTLPLNIGGMSELLAFWAYDCRFTAPFPNSLWTTPKLEDIDLTNNPLNTTPPSEFSLMPKLSGLVLPNTGLYGTVPNSWSGKLWRRVELQDNKLDSLPNLSSFSNAPSCNCHDSILNIKNNRVTFDDILPTLSNWQSFVPIVYAPQDSIFKDTTITARVGDPLSINLNIDGGLTTNSYKWFKNGAPFRTPTNSNTLIFTNLQTTDAGVYTCEVTNSNAPLLTLYSRKITIVVNPALVDTTTCRYKDSLQLISLYKATNGANWTVKWDTTKSMTTWFGVTLNTEGCLTILNLENNQLKGTLPNLSFSNLKILAFSSNQLEGAIPNFTMPLLEGLSLTLNKLTSTIPNFAMPNLTKLDLSGNQLTGNIPPFTMPLLQYMYLNDNQLTGTVPNFSMPKLLQLYLSNNQLSGNIPNFNMPLLQQFYLDRNQLSGVIPSFTLPNLIELSLYANKLTGGIPNFTMPRLEKMLLSFNQITGTIPTFNMPLLKIMDIRNNQLTGNIPNFTMPNLDSLFLCCNQLSGTLPNFNLPNLKVLDIPFNQLSGALPNLQNLPQLFSLKINNNQFSGCFPTQWQRFCNIGYECRGNAQLAWQGDFQRFCNNEAQIGATCNDNISTTINDKIQADCSCKGTVLVDITSCRYQDSLALVALYDATNGDRWLNTINNDKKWKIPGVPITNWYGVYTNTEGCVVILDLDGINSAYGDEGNGNGLNGTLPDVLFSMPNLELLFLNGSSNKINALPNSVGRATKLRELQLADCGISSLSDSVWTLTNLEGFVFNNNPINRTLPSAISGLRNIIRLHFANCQIKGALPESLANLTNLRFLDIQNNQIDSFPNISQLALAPRNLARFRLQGNKLTFDDLLNRPNLSAIDSFIYAPQAPFFKDTTVNLNVGDPLSINLNIDGGLTDNNYRWFKNGVEVPSLFSRKNALILRGVSVCDAGDYTCEVTNPNAQLLTLKSKTIKIVVNGTLPTSRLDTTICYGQSYRLPNGQTVSTTTNFQDIIKNVRQCDSLIRIVNLTVSAKPDSTVQNAAICFGKTYTLPNGQVITPSVNTTFRDTVFTNGCSSRYNIIRLIVNALPVPVVNDTAVCAGSSARLWIRNNTANFKNYQWQTNTATTSSATYTPSVSTTFFVTVTDVNGCIGSDSARIVVNTKPTATIVGVNSLYCKDNSTVVLQGQPSGGTFRLDGNSASSFNTNTLSVGNHTLNYVYRDANGCADTSMQTFRLADVARSTLNRSICLGDTLKINNQFYHKNHLTGTDILRGASKDGCDSIVTVQISLYPKVVANDDSITMSSNKTDVTINVLDNDSYPANLIDVNLKNKSPFGIIEEKGTGIFNIQIPRVANGSITFSYELCPLSCPNQCDTALVKVFIKNANPRDIIETMITPNGDGKNDVLDFPEIDWTKYPDNQIEIYNRWSQTVFTAAPYKRDWGGQNQNGQDLPAGDYFVILRLSIGDGKIIVGSVYVQR